MDRKKIILSIVGFLALVLPVVLLIVFSGNKTKQPPSTSLEQRQIDPQTVEDVVNKFPTPEPISIPSQVPSTRSATPRLEGSPQAQ